MQPRQLKLIGLRTGTTVSALDRFWPENGTTFVSRDVVLAMVLLNLSLVKKLELCKIQIQNYRNAQLQVRVPQEIQYKLELTKVLECNIFLPTRTRSDARYGWRVEEFPFKLVVFLASREPWLHYC